MSCQRERNKVVVVTVDKTESDLSYVRKEFMKAFNHANNISIDVTFHKYDPDRDDYVDLSNDCILKAKEKLKAVITPRIVTPCSIVNDSEGSLDMKRKLIKKEGEDKVPLPGPFSLPLHSSTDVERALKRKKMRQRTCWTLPMLYILGYILLCHGPSAAIATGVTMDCPLQNWNIYDYVQYYCTVNNRFLRFRVVGLNESDKSMIFSSSDNSGLTLTSEKFSSTLVTKENGLTAVITFSATINISKVICDDFVTTKICNVTIKGPPFKTIITGVHLNIDNNGSHKVKIDWFFLSGAFRISHYIVKTSDNRIFNVSTDGETSIDIGDFVREDIKYNATVTGVDIAGNIGEESDPVFFILDKPLNNSESVAVKYVLDDGNFYAIISWQGDNSTRPPIQFYEICYMINNKSVCMVTNNLFFVINETSFSGENVSFTLIANNLYGNTTLYNNFIVYIAVPITAVLAAIITVLIITCIVCIVTRKKAGKTVAASQEKLDTVDLPLPR